MLSRLQSDGPAEPDRPGISGPAHSTLFQELTSSLFPLIFPTSCLLCRQELRALAWDSVCAACWGSMEPWRGAVCGRCGLPIVSARASEFEPATCGPCRTAEPGFDLARSYGVYGGALRKAILALKFHGKERLAGRLGLLLADFWSGIGAGAEPERAAELLIIPVPLHPARQRQRGFNQAELLARSLRMALSRRARAGKPKPAPLPRLESSVLRRVRPTSPQAGLSVRGRKENVRAVFQVVQPETVRDRRVVLIDDVMTTGATAASCAQALKRAGAGEVAVLTLARATPEFPNSPYVRPYHGALAVDDPQSSRR